ncbi:MAG: cytochrome b [Gammaproteobacteria bacterium]
MKKEETIQNYNSIAIFIHWLIAVGVFGLFGLGLWMTDLGYYDAWYQTAPWLHEGIGVMLFLFLIVRILWSRISSPPEHLSTHKRWEKIASRLVQNLLNILLFVISISGYLIITAKGDPLPVFDLFNIPASFTGIKNQEDLAGEIHLFLAWVLIIFASFHALAALKHHFIDKDRTLKRMLGL